MYSFSMLFQVFPLYFMGKCPPLPVVGISWQALAQEARYVDRATQKEAIGSWENGWINGLINDVPLWNNGYTIWLY
jgi:hypothetical protein